MTRILALGALLALTTACTPPEIQNTSGAAFLARGGISDPDIAAAAAIEPMPLAFPARVGVIRFVQNAVNTMPTKERDLLANALPDGIGEVTHLGPLEVSLMRSRRLYRTDAKGIRTLAASRHLDYVLVLSLDPHRNTAEAVFLDVRTGYAHASIETDGPGRGITNTFGHRPTNPNKIRRATLKLTKALQPHLTAMGERLVDG